VTEKQAIEIKRHRRTMTEKQMDKVTVAVADLLVNFVKSRGTADLQKQGRKPCEVTNE
jgi:hypothetical protein